MHKRKVIPADAGEPQDYRHRVEVAIEGMAHAIAGVRMIVIFLKMQQSPEWRSTQAVKTATSDFRSAIKWLRRADAVRSNAYLGRKMQVQRVRRR
jgi:hypothetical protein